MSQDVRQRDARRPVDPDFNPLDAGIILASFVLLLFVRELREEVQEPVRASLQREPG